MEPAVTDLQLQFLWTWVELHSEKEPFRVPGPELEVNRKLPGGGGSRRERQDAAGGAQEGAGNQLGW